MDIPTTTPHGDTTTAAVPSLVDWQLRLESEGAERDLAELQRSEPDVVLAMDYVSGALSPDEHVAFEERMARDPALQALVFPLLQLRQAMSDRRDRAVESGEPAARRALQRLRAQLLREGADNEGADAPAGDRDTPPALAGRAAARAERVARLALRAAGLLACLVVSVYLLSLFGPWSPLTPSWRVMRDDRSLDAGLTLLHDVQLFTVGPYFIAERAPGWVNTGNWFSNVSELYADAAFLSVSTPTGGQREIRLDTPHLRIQSKGGRFKVEVENSCEVKVTSEDGQLFVSSRLAPPAPATLLQPGLSIMMECNGRLGLPGAARSAAPSTIGRTP